MHRVALAGHTSPAGHASWRREGKVEDGKAHGEGKGATPLGDTNHILLGGESRSVGVGPPRCRYSCCLAQALEQAPAGLVIGFWTALLGTWSIHSVTHGVTGARLAANRLSPASRPVRRRNSGPGSFPAKCAAALASVPAPRLPPRVGVDLWLGTLCLRYQPLLWKSLKDKRETLLRRQRWHPHYAVAQRAVIAREPLVDKPCSVIIFEPHTVLLNRESVEHKHGGIVVVEALCQDLIWVQPVDSAVGEAISGAY